MSNGTSRLSPPPPQRLDWDVIIVGAGAAGLYASLCLPANYRVLLITKDELQLSASDWAQGGIAAAIAPEDSAQLHIEDTLKAGVGLCDEGAVSMLVRQAPDCIESLVALGVGFDRGDQSQLAMTREAAHSRSRVLHAADRTGRAVVTTLAEAVLERANIEVFSQAFVLDLWRSPDGQRCRGVSLIYQGTVQWLSAGAVVLATGGGGQVFAQTTNPTLSTGDGVAIAYRAGVQLRDLEFFQFHPTALMKAGAPHFLISEAVRGEGAHLVDETGRRFAFDYHPEGELAPRDVVSRSIFLHLQKTGQQQVWLDLRPIAPDRINYRFPNILRVCRHWGIDPLETPIPVSPAAHYWMGGIVTDLTGQTSLAGLYAVGETASTGVHGANRLASNSLLECIVFGRALAQMPLPSPLPEREASLSSSGKLGGDAAAESRSPVLLEQLKPQQAILAELRDQLAQALWQGAGICRHQLSLETAIAQVSGWRSRFEALRLSQQLRSLISEGAPADPGQPLIAQGDELPLIPATLRAWGELDNLLTIGDLILKSALFRQESRGGHYRLDYPETEPDWAVHTVVERGGEAAIEGADRPAHWRRSPLITPA